MRFSAGLARSAPASYSLPKTSSVSNSGGAFLRPQTATRMGWNICPGLNSQLLSSGAESLIQRIVFELDVGQHIARAREDLQRHRHVSLLRDEFGGIVGRQLIDEEEVGGGEHVAQQLDALANQRRDLQHLFRRDVETGAAHDGQQAGAQVLYRQAANVLGVEPERLGIEGLFRELQPAL